MELSNPLQFKEQLWRSNPTCSICEQRIHTIDDAEVDHIEQYWRGGETIPSNARLTHRYCNRARSRSEILPETTPVYSSSNNIASTTNNPSERKIKRKRGGIKQEEYRLPILKILAEKKDGKVRSSEVCKIIEERTKHLFNDLDKEIITRNKKPRWEHNVHWARNGLVEEGLLKSGSERGIWEISDEGRRFLQGNNV